MYIEDPVTNEDFFSIWRAPAAVTITEIYCKATGGTSVLFDIANNSSAVNGSEVSCTTGGTTDSSMGGDATVVDGELIDANLGVVTGSVDAVSLCFEYTIP
jgi:hypothetical protein